MLATEGKLDCSNKTECFNYKSQWVNPYQCIQKIMIMITLMYQTDMNWYYPESTINTYLKYVNYLDNYVLSTKWFDELN